MPDGMQILVRQKAQQTETALLLTRAQVHADADPSAVRVMTAN